jgi:hypothetical protein
MEPSSLGSAAREDYDRRKMRLPSVRILAVILAAGLVAVAAGCGGGSKKSAATTSGPEGTRVTTITFQKTTVSSSTSAFASAQNCQDMAGLAAKAAAAVAASGSAGNVLQTESTEIQALAKAAPSEIRGDFQTLSAAFSGFVDALQTAGYKLGSKTPPSAAQIAAFAKAAKSFDTPKLKQAERHLNAWARQNCKGVHTGG